MPFDLAVGAGYAKTTIVAVLSVAMNQPGGAVEVAALGKRVGLVQSDIATKEEHLFSRLVITCTSVIFLPITGQAEEASASPRFRIKT